MVVETENIISPLIFDSNQKQQIESLIHNLNEKQLVWLAGYLTGISQAPLKTGQADSKQTNGASVPTGEYTIATSLPELTVLFGSRTGNGLSIAKKLLAEAEAKGFKVQLFDMNEYQLHKLKEVKHLLVIVSTHGEGVPPIAAEEFYNFLHGKRAPKLENTKFSVLALGDKSYVHFCKTGKDVDQRLEELGGKRIFKRIDCDVDFTNNAQEWINGILTSLSGENTQPNVKVNGHAKLNGSPDAAPAVVYNKQNPYKARILEKIKLNGKGSTKETFHFELSLDKSGISYEPGDAIGVFGSNPERLVYELADKLALNPGGKIEYEGTETTLGDVLTRRYEISTLNPDVIEKYNQIAQSKKLTTILGNTDDLIDFVYGRDFVDLVSEFPVKLTPEQLTGILRKLQPRLYSIASSPTAHPDEVHLTVSVVRYVNSRYKEGVCSSFLSDRIGDKEAVPVYLEHNLDFRLPSNPDAPVIMVGPGTGIAPFRAFLHERDATGAKGKNWLFFGDRHFTTDFLYQTELQAFHKKGLLTNLNVAFSRDTDKKVYVQHKMEKHSKELFRWLEEGAYFYVCGDMKNMWTDVNRTLTNIIAKEGRVSLVKAEEYIKRLKKEKRYQADVY
jgi:sulfite reductase (NADPH) flavoprotein alpha-component